MKHTEAVYRELAEFARKICIVDALCDRPQHLSHSMTPIFACGCDKPGYWIVWTPHAELIHHESVSSGLDDTEENAIFGGS